MYTCYGNNADVSFEKCLSYHIPSIFALQWRHNGHDSISNHQPQDCLLNRSFRRRSKKTSKLRVTGLCAVFHRGPVNSPHKWPVTRKMFPFDDVIMETGNELTSLSSNSRWNNVRSWVVMMLQQNQAWMWIVINTQQQEKHLICFHICQTT